MTLRGYAGETEGYHLHQPPACSFDTDIIHSSNHDPMLSYKQAPSNLLPLAPSAYHVVSIVQSRPSSLNFGITAPACLSSPNRTLPTKNQTIRKLVPIRSTAKPRTFLGVHMQCRAPGQTKLAAFAVKQIMPTQSQNKRWSKMVSLPKRIRKKLGMMQLYKKKKHPSLREACEM